MSIDITANIQRDHFQLQLNCSIPSTGITAIYGHSGAGKTSLLRLIAGLDNSPQANVRFNNDIWQAPDTFIKPEHRHIAYVFQDARLFPHLDVLGNLQFAFRRRANKQYHGPTIEQVCEWLQLDSLLSQNAATLSGGQQQRVAIGRALLTNPQLILMDEPLGALDHQSREQILQLLEQLHQYIDVPMLYVSHSIEELSRLAEQLIILENGQLTTQGPLLELCHRLDLSLAHEEHAAAIIQGHIVKHDERYQLSEFLTVDQQRLYLSLCHSPIGSSLKLRIPARDVSLSLKKQDDSSILNILPCTITAIEPRPSPTDQVAQALIKLQLGQQYLLARLTYKSLDRLQLRVGQQVFAQIKSVALLSNKSSYNGAYLNSSTQQ